MQFNVRMEITDVELEKLKSYVSPVGKTAVQDVDDILTRLIHRVRLLREHNAYDDEGLEWPLWIKENVRFSLHKALVILAAVAVVVVTILLVRNLNTTGVLILSVVVLVVASAVYEGINMYQKLEAEKFAEQKKLNYDIPEQCNPGNVNILRQMGWAIQTNIFGMEDPCKKYFELHMVDTKFKISPLVVLTTMFGRVMETFAKFSGSSFGIFYSEAMERFNFFGKLAIIVVVTIVLITAIRHMGPALMYTLPNLTRTVRHMPTREMLQEIPTVQPQALPGDPRIPQERDAISAKCSHCHGQQTLREAPRPKRQSPNKSTHIHIKDVKTLVIERTPVEGSLRKNSSVEGVMHDSGSVEIAALEAPSESDYESSSDV